MKTLLSLILCCAALSPLALRAELIPADKAAIPAIKEALSEKYGCKINDNGDLMINGKNGKLHIRVIPEAKVIRLYCSYAAYPKRTPQEMVSLANRFNWQKRLLRVAVDPESGASVCDHFVLYKAGLDPENLAETIGWFETLMGIWESYVIHGGEKKEK